MSDDEFCIPPGENTGVLDPAPPPGGWVAGAETGAVPIVLEATGQYDSYTPDDEWQSLSGPFFDTAACVTFSATNNLEFLINRARFLAQLPEAHETFLREQGFINPVTNKVNFSDRFTAKMSGTTHDGNNLGTVGESIRKLHGLLPEKDWQFPDFGVVTNPDTRWAIYYSSIPQELQAKAKLILNYFKFTYQWVANGSSTPSSLRGHLQHGPFQIAAAVCSPWGNNQDNPPIQKCGCTTQHATTIYGYRDDHVWKDYDHYKSFKKYLSEDYCIPYALQYYLEILPIQSGPQDAFHYTFNQNLKYGNPASDEVHKLQEALQYLKRVDGMPYMQKGLFGPYGPATKASVGRFQVDKGIPDPDGSGTNFGPQTRAAMNAALA